MAYNLINRLNFIVKYLFDIDGNGYVDKRDFMCLALRSTIIENKGEFNFNKFYEYQHIMLCLWDEIAYLADFDKSLLLDEKIGVKEFRDALHDNCSNRKFGELPQALKMFIDANFRMIDLNEDGVIDINEFRYYCITKFAIDDLNAVNEAFDQLLSDDDRKRGGLVLNRYQELYAQFLGTDNNACQAKHLFGPLSLIDV